MSDHVNKLLTEIEAENHARQMDLIRILSAQALEPPKRGWLRRLLRLR